MSALPEVLYRRNSSYATDDALGSVRMITDSTGASVAHYEFDAWGNLLASSSDISFGFNYRYVGALGVRWDATLGMYYMRQRWYDPTLQRFISRDPMGLKAGPNLYEYVGNSPVDRNDPSGLDVSIDGRVIDGRILGGVEHGPEFIVSLLLAELELAEDHSIHCINISGHGNNVIQTFSMADHTGHLGKLEVMNGTVVLKGVATNGGANGPIIQGFTELLKQKLAPDAKITFYGCHCGNVRGVAQTASGTFDVETSGSPEFVWNSDRGFILKPATSIDDPGPGKTFGDAKWGHWPGVWNNYFKGRPRSLGNTAP